MESSDEESGDDSNRYDDAEDDMDIEYHTGTSAASSAVVPPAHSQYADVEEDGDDDDDDEEAEEAVDVEAVDVEPVRPVHGIRGKPEAMAMALAASKIDEVKEELEAEKQHDDDDEEEEAAVVSTEVEATDVVAEPLAEAISDAKAVDARATPVAEAQVTATEVVVKPPPKKKRKTPSKKSSGASSSKKSSSKAIGTFTLDDPVDPIRAEEYENLISLMEHFCKVPLLAEFSRPVTLLHPELMAAYSRIVKNPIDLGKVCRKIGRRQYRNVREVQLEGWKIFSNCVKYHSHPSNKEGVPSFVSISLHLREYWNNLFQEFMLPSDAPKAASSDKTAAGRYLKETYAIREADRSRRLIVSGLTCMSTNCMKKSAEKINAFIALQGRVDRLDLKPIFPGESSLGSDIDHDDQRDLQVVVERLGQFRLKLLQMAADNAEYTVEQFDGEMKACYQSEDVFENNSALKFRVRNRINRFVGKILVPINEANCRGVTQSSIWGCMAAAIWARESSKKPFWPALVLGILAPEDQKEGWHRALTERNEQRLPEALRSQLSAGKRKAEQALKRQSQGHADPQSFFLVEFLGTHEFIWVRETDIVESFEPDDDPNLKAPPNKKKRAGARAANAAVVGSKKYQAAIEEAGWALEEFEMQLQDACGDMGDEEDAAEDGNYSYTVLCVSDDEADDAYDEYNVKMTAGQVEEANELIATRGLIDFSVTGRKNAKKRALALKKQKMDAEKKEKLEKDKKRKADQAKKKKKDTAAAKSKEREEKKEQRELEKRRKKRSREREKSLKSARKNKRRRFPEDHQQERAEGGLLLTNKRARATALVKGYLTRMAGDEDYRSLGLQGIMSIPAAMVDSSGLLGMALAFRAAAGELTMPTESGDQETVKPWDAVVVDETMTEGQRQEALEKQVTLLEQEIKRVKSATTTRLNLAKEAAVLRGRLDEEVIKDEQVARTNPYKKKKKVVGSTSKSTDNSPEVETKSELGKDEKDGEGDEVMKEAQEIPDDGAKAEGEETMINLGPSHVTDTPPRQSAPAPAGTKEDEDN